MKLFVLPLVLFASLALAAPDEDVLLKPKGLVDVWSRMDEFNAAHGVQKAATPRPLKRAESVPDLGLDEFLNANRNTGLLVLKGDTVLAERYQYGRNAGHRFASASMAKTVLAMLVGIAFYEKKIQSLDDRVEQYVPALKGQPYGATSIRHLLTMSSGIQWRETWSGERDEGIRLVENTVRGKTEGGADTVYLSEKIWQPMGAEANATWLVDKAGYETGYCCINATLRDYGRFGLLLANGGALDGKQIIPAEWVKAATTASAPYLRVGFATANNGYGYQTWLIGDQTGRPREGGDPVERRDPMFAALGVRGQAIFVDPASKLVVVHTAVWIEARDTAARGEQFRLWARLLNTLSSAKTL
jgi:CubicO group peptidase (beta-lactamase class C family)